MDCFICGQSVASTDGERGEAFITCDFCGDYRISSVARGVMANARVALDKGSMLVALARKRLAGKEIPLLREIDLVFDRAQLADQDARK